MTVVDLESLGRAIARLEEVLAVHQAEPGNLIVRDAIMKHCEFTYEISQSTRRRFVETYSVHLKSSEQLTLPALIRTASEDAAVQGGCGGAGAG